MFTGKTTLLLDMNSTFMFGEDRFGEDEDFSIHYAKTGGSFRTMNSRKSYVLRTNISIRDILPKI